MRGILLALPDAPARGAGQPEVKGIGEEGLERQVAELERALSVTAEQLAQAKHRNERMALLEPASSKEVASLAAYDRQMRNAISDELEVCTAAELECIDAIACIDSASIDLLVRLDPSGPFLLPLSRVTELSNANSEFLDAVQALMDGGGKCADADGVAGMRQVAMQELHRLQDLFVNNELDRTDALQMKEEALAMEGVAQAQLAELANSGSIRAQVNTFFFSAACLSRIACCFWSVYRWISRTHVLVFYKPGDLLISCAFTGAQGWPGNRGGKGCGKTQRHYKLDQTSRKTAKRLGVSATPRTQKFASVAYQGGRLCAAAR